MSEYFHGFVFANIKHFVNYETAHALKINTVLKRVSVVVRKRNRADIKLIYDNFIMWVIAISLQYQDIK